MGNLDVLVMTGDKLRHKYYALQILKAFKSSGLLTEKQPAEPWGSHVRYPSEIIQKHFEAFNEQEKVFFGKEIEANQDFLSEKKIIEIYEGDINSDAVITQIKEIDPKVLIVLSTSLLSDTFIANFPHRIINYHAGLSPYYRGSGTNVFPFYNKELEYVGITIHYIDPGIDSGNIIVQGRPVFEETDNTHTIGCKNLIMGTKLMIETIDFYLNIGPPAGHAQDLSAGRVYYKKDFTDEIVTAIQNNIASGIVTEYVKIQPKPIKIVGRITHE